MTSTQALLLPDFARTASEKRMNHEATELCAEINQARLGQVARGVLPIEVVNLCHAIAQQITAGQDVNTWEGAHLRLLIADLAPPMLIRGFGIPGFGDINHTRILIMLDRIVSREPVSISQTFERLHLSTRGRGVVKGLIQGLTNKEIAQQFRITEQTVKGHIQRLMRKTKTTTRTGLLARLLLKSDIVGIIGSVFLSF
jgi:DNA-binding CsgD family transcriptional regulator